MRAGLIATLRSGSRQLRMYIRVVLGGVGGMADRGGGGGGRRIG